MLSPDVRAEIESEARRQAISAGAVMRETLRDWAIRRASSRVSQPLSTVSQATAGRRAHSSLERSIMIEDSQTNGLDSQRDKAPDASRSWNRSWRRQPVEQQFKLSRLSRQFDYDVVLAYILE